MCLFGEQPAGSSPTLILPDLVPPAHSLSLASGPGSSATHPFRDPMASWGLAVLWQRVSGTGDPCMLMDQAKVPEDSGLESSL